MTRPHVIREFFSRPYVLDQKMYKQLSEAAKNISLSAFIMMTKGRSLPKIDSKLRYQEVNIERRKACGNDKSKARRIEQENMAKNMLIPRFNRVLLKMPPEEQEFLKKRLDGLPKDNKYMSPIEYSLNFMPAFAVFVEMCTVTGFDDNRKDSLNDFFDRDLMVYQCCPR